jgi:hypothetical protein
MLCQWDSPEQNAHENTCAQKNVHGIAPIASEVEDSPAVPAVQQFCDLKVRESRFKIY